MPATVYTYQAFRRKVVMEGEIVIRDVQVQWVEPGLDSPELQAKVKREIVERTGLKVRPDKLELVVHAVGPRELLGETKIFVAPPRPAAQAQVVLRRATASAEERQACFEFEEELEKRLEGSEIGFLDGNEVSPDQHDIFLYGPRKQPLLEWAKVAIAGREGWSIV